MGEPLLMRLRLVPVSLEQANQHVAAWHRHSSPVVGHKWSVGAADDNDVLRAVAIVGRPIARHLDNGLTLEVLRVATDGTRNANSLLYGACARASFAMGYRQLVTYVLADESGSSLRAAGWRVVAQLPPRRGWSTPSRPRDNGRYNPAARQLWEAPC